MCPTFDTQTLLYMTLTLKIQVFWNVALWHCENNFPTFRSLLDLSNRREPLIRQLRVTSQKSQVFSTNAVKASSLPILYSFNSWGNFRTLMYSDIHHRIHKSPSFTPTLSGVHRFNILMSRLFYDQPIFNIILCPIVKFSYVYFERK